MSNDYILTDDSLLIAGTGNNDFDIYKKYTEETGDEFTLTQVIVSGCLIKVYYGVPKISWENFCRYLDTLNSRKNNSIRVIWIPVNIDINGEETIVVRLTFLDYIKKAVLFNSNEDVYFNEDISWRSIDENNFFEKDVRYNLSAFCDHLNATHSS